MKYLTSFNNIQIIIPISLVSKRSFSTIYSSVGEKPFFVENTSKTMLFNNNIRIATHLTRSTPIIIIKRTMMLGSSVHTARAIYHFASILSNSSILDKIDKKNVQPFINEVVEATLDSDKGILQYKTALFKHLSNQRFQSELFYDKYRKVVNKFNIRCEPHTEMDFRMLNELGVIQEYQRTFDNNIEWIYATMDSRSANFPHQKQPYVDFWVMVRMKMDHAMGLRHTYKCVYQDEKSGMDILNHSTRGSIGMLVYDSAGDNIPVTRKPITIQDLIEYNTKRVRMISDALKLDNVYDIFENTISNAHSISREMNGKSFQEVIKLHETLQDLLWNELHNNPLCKRSLSFVFIKEIINTPNSDRENAFSNAFRSKIQNKIYDLDKRQDFMDIYKAMLHAGKTIDPDFVKKLYHLHNSGITFNNNFLLVLAEFVKHGY